MTLVAPVEVRRLGRVEYADGLAMQARFADAIAAGRARDTFLLLEHDHVLTLGRGATAENVLFPPEYLAGRDVEIHETTRGGDVTYHGPGQVVGYPIFDLKRADAKDVRKFVRSLEEVMIRACSDFGISAHRDEKHTGVWVGRDKIGAIGVRIAKWITSHGFALNVATDLSYFDLIVPCGIPDRGVTSISRLAGRDVTLAEVEDRIEAHAAEVFAREVVRRDVDVTTVGVVVRRGQEALVLHRVPERGCFWQIVTGRMERGETPAAAARRELREETGYDVPVTFLYEHAFAVEGRDAPDGAPMLGREVVFLANVAGDPRRCEEHDELRWCAAPDAVALVKHAGHKRALKLAMR